MKLGKYWWLFVAFSAGWVLSLFQINASYHNANGLFIALAVLFAAASVYCIRKV